MFSAKDQRVNVFTVVGHMVSVTSTQFCSCSEKTATAQRTNKPGTIPTELFPRTEQGRGDLACGIQTQVLHSWCILTCWVVWIPVCYYPELTGEEPVAARPWNWPPKACYTVQSSGAAHTTAPGAGQGSDLACGSVDCGDHFMTYLISLSVKMPTHRMDVGEMNQEHRAGFRTDTLEELSHLSSHAFQSFGCLASRGYWRRLWAGLGWL